MKTLAFDIAALNPSFKAHSSRGIGRYVRELDSYFRANPPEDFFVKAFSSLEALNKNSFSEFINLFPFGRTTIRQQCIGPFAFKALGAELLHFPAHIDAPAWCPCPYVVTVLDLIPIIFEDLYKAEKPSWRFHFARWLECESIKNASMILCISENTAKDVQRILGVADEKLAVTPLGVDQKFFEVKKVLDETTQRLKLGLPVEVPIVLYLGGIDQRKNIKGLIEIFKRARGHFIEPDAKRPILVIAGDVSSDEQYPKVQALIKEHNLSESVYFTGYLNDEDLLKLFSISSAFCFPSLYEGFGLPPLEAMASGIPVISSNSSAMPEVLGDGAVLVNPHNIEEASDALVKILTDEYFAASLSEKGRLRARQYSWSTTGQKTVEVYRKLLLR
ncbi:MAG: glycosyltransferase family 4 protein [SAR324 cluster bacterium]|uniref:Glycosyltransferase family 4 protein n=1 Tax=SAR324 cluster bacterium TaxID=2024889 RepID=A0A7X9FU40_9DELT|nr:glycosyltransferase family 4 protein [SAR324 cluster bacterium]